MKTTFNALCIGVTAEFAAMLIGLAAFASDSHFLSRLWEFMHTPSGWLAHQLFSVSGRSTIVRDFSFMFVVQSFIYAGVALPFLLFLRRHDNAA